MNHKHPSKRKQTIQKIAIYSLLLMFSLNLAFLEKESSKEEGKRSKIYTKSFEEEKKEILSPRDRNLKAYNYIKEKNYTNASKEFLQVIKNSTDTSDTNEQLAYAYMNLAWCFHQLGEEENSFLTLEEFLTIFKNSPVPYIQQRVTKAESILATK